MSELTWDGKYDKEGRRVAPLRVSLPFQTVETVNEAPQDRQRSLDLFTAGKDPSWRNRLIWGDKKYVLPALISEFAGKVDLIYIDPPFATGQDFTLPVSVNGEDFVKQPSMIEVKAYRDTWGVTADERERGVTQLDRYLGWFHGTAILFHELLSESGSLYVHLDPGMSHYVKALLDEVFGSDNFRSEVIWKRTHAHSGANRYGPVHDVLLYYGKGAALTWNVQRTAYTDEYVEAFFRFADSDGRRYRATILTAPGIRKGASGLPWRGVDPTKAGRHWAIPGYVRHLLGAGKALDVQAALEELDRIGRILWPAKIGGIPTFKQYIDDMEGTEVQDVWTDIPPIGAQSQERLPYPTQKPEALLERIILTSSLPGDLVLDCVCGSGTTAAMAEKTGRRWIAGDLGRFAIHTTRKRLLSIPACRSFVVQNLGKYERQLWQAAEFGEAAQARTVAYRRFILAIYKAQPIEGYAWLHGVKQGRLVHVGTVDAPVTVGDVKQIAAEFAKAMGSGKDAPTVKAVDILGWDFAFEMNEIARQTASRGGIDVRFWQIPREVLDKRAVEQGDVRFFELAALSVDAVPSGKKVILSLRDFLIPHGDVPEEVQRAIRDWSQWIDYWAVDWDNKGDTFHNEWQAYRTRKEKSLQKSASHIYESAGTYQVVVKVIDILGNDTTKTLTVVVK
jgi:adenine-specific DNA-methyltransferase